jgi:nucleotide-binding universal stress UspA family protein
MSNNEKSEAVTHDVVVGVDGSPASVAALRYAGAEAERLGAAVHVVHAIRTYVPMAPRYPLPVDELVSTGRAVLRRTVEEAEVPASVELTTTLSRTGSIPSLVDASRHARSVVVGADRRPVPTRIFTGDVSTGVAARSSAPVIAVPETWPSHSATGKVLVGIKRPDHAAELLAEAFATARSRGASLVVLHAWRLTSGYDDLIANHATYVDWDTRATDEMTKVLEEWRSAYPDVEVELRTAHEQPAHALVSASAEVDEVVLVRRAHGVPAALHLGPTARAVLAHAHCPVRIVPAEHRSSTPDPVREDAGALAT